MMADAMEVLDDDADIEESDQIVNAILDEIGINLNEQLLSAPDTSLKNDVKVASKEKQPILEAAGNVGSSQPAISDEDRALEERLNKLKK